MSVKLRKRGGSYYLDIYENGKRRYEYLNTKMKGIDKREWNTLARAIRDQVARDLLQGRYSIDNAGKREADILPLFHDFKHLRHYKNYKACINHLRGFAGREEIPCYLVTEQFCMEFKYYLRKKLGGQTPYNYFRIFKQVMKMATKRGFFQVNPAADIKNEDLIGNQVRKEALTEDEVRSLYAAKCDNPEVRRAFLFALQTGLRNGNIEALKWSDVSLKERYIRFTQIKRRNIHVIPLNDNAMQILSECPQTREYVFRMPKYNHSVTLALKKWCARAGIRKHITFYCARHTFVTGILMATGNLKVASQLAGHSDIKMTERYTHLVDKNRRDAVDMLPRMVGE